MDHDDDYDYYYYVYGDDDDDDSLVTVSLSQVLSSTFHSLFFSSYTFFYVSLFG